MKKSTYLQPETTRVVISAEGMLCQSITPLVIDTIDRESLIEDVWYEF